MKLEKPTVHGSRLYVSLVIMAAGVCKFFHYNVRYLLEDQLQGPSSVQAYITALKRGCRCVECE